MKVFRMFFNGGLILAALTLLVTTATEVIYPGQSGRSLSLLYLVAAVTQVGLLAWVGGTLPVAQRVQVPNALYTAGFVHTLVGLGTAVVHAAAIIGRAHPTASTGLDLSQLGPVLASMGGALLPHAVAVWAGNLLESSIVDPLSTIETSILKKLSDDADETRAVLKDLYQQRQALLQQEVNSLKRQLTAWDDVHSQLVATSETAQKAISVAMVHARDGIASMGDAGKGVAAEFAKETRGIQQSLTAIRESSDAAAVSAGGAAHGFRSVTTDADQLAMALKQATNVVKDLKGLQESIVELLDNRLFSDPK